jgi:hypothetical protein
MTGVARRRGFRGIGAILAALLPLAVLFQLPLSAGVPGYLEAFWAAITAGHLGLLVRQGGMDWLRWLQDLAVAALMAGGAWLAVHLSLRAGGGPVDRALLAVIAAYLLMLWPAVNVL